MAAVAFALNICFGRRFRRTRPFFARFCVFKNNFGEGMSESVK